MKQRQHQVGRGKGRKEEVKGEGECEGKSSRTETVTEMLRKQLWTSICQLETKIECKALRHDVDVDVDGERWQSEAGAALLLVAPDAVKANFGFNFCCIFVAFTELLLMLWRTEAQAQSADRGMLGRGVWKSSQVNAVIVGAANMALPQSATAEAATATESALDNEKLKQEAEVVAERTGTGRGSWHESFRNVKMLCTLEVTVSGRGRVRE